MGGQTLVVVDIGVADLNAVLVDAFQDDVVAASGPVALDLRGHDHIAVLQSLLGLVGLVGLLFQIEAQHRGLILEDHGVGAVAVAVFAVAGAEGGRCQLRIRHIGGEHGKACDAAAMGAELIIAIHGVAEVLLQIDGNLRVALMGDVLVEHTVIGEGSGFRCQRNGGICNPDGVFVQTLLHEVAELLLLGALLCLNLSLGVDPGNVEHMDAAAVANDGGISCLTLWVKAPCVQLRGELPLLHLVVEAALFVGGLLFGFGVGNLCKAALAAAEARLPGVQLALCIPEAVGPALLAGGVLRQQKDVAKVHIAFSGGGGFGFLLRRLQIVAHGGQVHIGVVVVCGGLEHGSL